MKKLIALLTSISLYANTIYVLKTQDLYGRCSIESGDIIIKHPALKIDIPRYVKVINCSNLECIDYEVSRLKHLYRTNGIHIEEIK